MLEKIQELCKERSITVSKLEKELGFGNGSMYKWDKSSPSIDKVQKVANYFNVSLDLIIYGFELTEFVQMVNYIRNDRTYEQFSEDTGVDLYELTSICEGIKLDPPSFETVKKIASSNPVDFIVTEEDLLNSVGYFTENEADAARSQRLSELKNLLEENGYEVGSYYKDYIARITIDYEGIGTVEDVLLEDFLQHGEWILKTLKEKHEIQTIAAHHDGDDWTEEELEEIERFKEFVRSKRKQQE